VHAAVKLSKVVGRELAGLPKQDAPSVRMVRRRHARALERESPEVVLEFVRVLLKDAGWAERVVAWETLANHPAHRAVSGRRRRCSTNASRLPGVGGRS
jgi:hypothetical protein